MKLPKFGAGSELDLLRQSMGAGPAKPQKGRKPMLFHPEFIRDLGKPKVGVEVTAAELEIRRAQQAQGRLERYSADGRTKGIYQPQAGEYDAAGAVKRREDGVIRTDSPRSGRVIKPR
jgi:hypothetical protein